MTLIQGGEVDKTQLEFMHAGRYLLEFIIHFALGQGFWTHGFSGLSMGAEKEG